MTTTPPTQARGRAVPPAKRAPVHAVEGAHLGRLPGGDALWLPVVRERVDGFLAPRLVAYADGEPAWHLSAAEFAAEVEAGRATWAGARPAGRCPSAPVASAPAPGSPVEA